MSAWTEQDDRRLVRWSKQLVPVAEIARRLGKTYGQVTTRRTVMKQAGRLSHLGYAGHREWTEQDDLHLVSMFQEGRSYGMIASQLKRTRQAVTLRLQRLGISRRIDRRMLTANEAGAMMGKDPKTIVLWIKGGWLKGHQNSPKRNSAWRIDPFDLWAFVDVPECHMSWDPERITDPDLREHARAIRATAVRWLTSGEVGKRYGVQHSAVNDWIGKGLLMGIKWGNWWIPEDALTGFVPPCDVSRKKRDTIESMTYNCCRRRIPVDLIFTEKRDRICDRCRPHIHRLSTGTIIRFYPPSTRRLR